MAPLLIIPEFFGFSIVVYLLILIIAILVFFIWSRILKNNINDKKKRNIAAFAITLITTPLICFIIVILVLFYTTYYPSNYFDRQKWLNDKEKRYELSEDIIESNLLIGKTKIEVKQILGGEGNGDNSNLWNYYLGYKPQILVLNPDVLDVEFKNGKVIKVVQRLSKRF